MILGLQAMGMESVGVPTGPGSDDALRQCWALRRLPSHTLQPQGLWAAVPGKPSRTGVRGLPW